LPRGDELFVGRFRRVIPPGARCELFAQFFDFGGAAVDPGAIDHQVGDVTLGAAQRIAAMAGT